MSLVVSTYESLVAPNISLPSLNHWYDTTPIPSSSAKVCDAVNVLSTAIDPVTVTLPVASELPDTALILLTVESYWAKVTCPWLAEIVPLSSAESLSVEFGLT